MEADASANAVEQGKVRDGHGDTHGGEMLAGESVENMEELRSEGPTPVVIAVEPFLPLDTLPTSEVGGNLRTGARDADVPSVPVFSKDSSGVAGEEMTLSHECDELAKADEDGRELGNRQADQPSISVADPLLTGNRIGLETDVTLDVGDGLQLSGKEMRANDFSQVTEELMVDADAGAEPLAILRGGGEISVHESEREGIMPARENDADVHLDVTKEMSGPSREEETFSSGGEGEGHSGGNAAAVEVGNELGEKPELSTAELVAKARAPVKKQFLTPAAVRLRVPNGGVIGAGSNNGIGNDSSGSRVVLERKSKRQLKRERLQVVVTMPRHEVSMKV